MNDTGRLASTPSVAVNAVQVSLEHIPVLNSIQPRLQILVAVAEQLFLEAFAIHLDAMPGLAVVATATRCQQAISGCLEMRPDLIVLDLDLPKLSGVRIAQRLQKAGISAPIILLLSETHDARHVAAAWAAGVRGFMLKQGSWDEFIHAIKIVPNGGVYVDARLANGLFSTKEACLKLDAKHDDLIPHERDVIRLFARGYTTKEIAHQLGMSATSAEKHKARAGQKLGLTTRASIVRYGMVQGWFEQD